MSPSSAKATGSIEMRRSNFWRTEILLVATCHHLPFKSSKVEPWPAAGEKPVGLYEKGELLERVYGPSGCFEVK